MDNRPQSRTPRARRKEHVDSDKAETEYEGYRKEMGIHLEAKPNW